VWGNCSKISPMMMGARSSIFSMASLLTRPTA
jgi:hypothetical protein